MLLSDGQQYALLYLELLKKINRVDSLQWVLVLIADALTGESTRQKMCEDILKIYYCSDHEERIPLFVRTSQKDPSLPYEPLLRYATGLLRRPHAES